MLNLNDVIVMYGYLLLSVKCGKVVDVLENVCSFYVKLREVFLKKGLLLGDVLNKYLLGFIFGNVFLFGRGVFLLNVKNVEFKGFVRVFYLRFKDIILDVKLMFKLEIIFYGSVVILLGEYVNVRKLFKDVFVKRKDDIEVYLFFCYVYVVGLVVWIDVYGYFILILVNDKVFFDLVKKEVFKVYVIVLRNLFVNYFVGFYLCKDNL